MTTKKFQKKKEDFTCQVCGTKVKGTGYTNHCPHCLWSKHVDLNPGDRQAVCQGLMKPVSLTQRKGKTQILYQCQKCNYKHFNQVTPEDDQEKITTLSQIPTPS